MLLPDCHARAYLIHDHEPEFFAMSAEQLWAERTYELGLYPISASTWLRDMMRERYGRDGSWFRFGVDHGTYRPREVERRRDTVMFYGRHVTPRRAVPLGMLALDELHRRRPDTRIVLFGDTEPPATSFPYEFLGVVNPEVLAWRYSEATVGLCLSLTNYSLIPQEMMACGLPCVDLAGGSPEAVFGRRPGRARGARSARDRRRGRAPAGRPAALVRALRCRARVRGGRDLGARRRPGREGPAARARGARGPLGRQSRPRPRSASASRAGSPSSTSAARSERVHAPTHVGLKSAARASMSGISASALRGFSTRNTRARSAATLSPFSVTEPLPAMSGAP